MERVKVGRHRVRNWEVESALQWSEFVTAIRREIRRHTLVCPRCAVEMPMDTPLSPSRRRLNPQASEQSGDQSESGGSSSCYVPASSSSSSLTIVCCRSSGARASADPCGRILDLRQQGSRVPSRQAHILSCGTNSGTTATVPNSYKSMSAR